MSGATASRAEALGAATEMLRAAGVDAPRRDARLLMQHALGLTPEALLAEDGLPLGEEEARRLTALVRRRASREPIAYLTGRREFWSLDFAVDNSALVPRPESETLVEAVLAHTARLPARPQLLDLGTGTGCLLAALLTELPGTVGLGIDVSGAADIDAEADRAGKFGEERGQQAARAGAEVEQLRAGREPRGVREHRLDQGLALWPRHQRGIVDGEVETPELAPAGEVGDRLARSAAPDERRQPPSLFLAERQAIFGEQSFGRKPQRVLHQQAGIATRRIDACCPQHLGSSAERLCPARRSPTHSASARRAARSAVISGSMTSSSASPLNTLSSL